MSATWNLNAIMKKTRQLTGRLSPSEMDNSELVERINRYYQLTFPAEVKLERQHTFYEFLTIYNQNTYTFDNVNYTNVEPPATVDNLQMNYYQDPGRFNENNPYQISRLTPWTGDGVTAAFSTTISGPPILQGSIVITDNVETFEDTNTTWTTANVNISGDLGGGAVVNYLSGSITVTFNTPPADGQLIYLSYIIFKAGRPVAVLFYNNEFKFYPPPDTAYRFKMKAYEVVTALTQGSDTPVLQQWGPAIAYGTAKQIFADYGELDAKREIEADYREQIDYVLAKTEQNLLNTRALPFF